MWRYWRRSVGRAAISFCLVTSEKGRWTTEDNILKKNKLSTIIESSDWITRTVASFLIQAERRQSLSSVQKEDSFQSDNNTYKSMICKLSAHAVIGKFQKAAEFEIRTGSWSLFDFSRFEASKILKFKDISALKMMAPFGGNKKH